ncbi:MAG: sulfatase-like hydrolase/transferase, partial [Anaerolineae bacterium]|nr:sulfatase-like hydrolase/transferase [Anaerolineae bacterium]
GMRFERAYTTCPLCTPARGALFSGLYPQINGAWTNNIAPHANIPLMGTIFSYYGYRTAYTGKWHLEGVSYFGDGVPSGGFEPDWWYDGVCYARDIGPEMFRQYRTCKTADALRQAGFNEETMWGHRVANRAIDFLQQVGDSDFTLVVSFDEPHGPFVAPPVYWEKFSPEDIVKPPNHGASLEGKPALQQVQRAAYGEPDWGHDIAWKQRFFGCNSYIDREIGRVIDAVQHTHGDDTVIIYTSDHGDMLEAHGLHGKGPMMYEEITNIPFIVHVPGGPQGVVSNALVSHLDVIPTMLELSGIEVPPSLHGLSLHPVLENPQATVREFAMVNFHRFAVNHDSFGEFFPIRCVTDGRYKLAVNLLDTDEFYDLDTDPLECHNRINDETCAAIRDRLHDALLDEMDRIR